jgi:hypothetical protein
MVELPDASVLVDVDERFVRIEMRESWLKPNRTAMVTAFALPALLILVAAAFAVARVLVVDSQWMMWTALTLTAIALIFAIPIVQGIRTPRLGYEDDCLLVYLRGAQPFQVPIEIVEVFFLGQGPAMVKAKGGENAETSTIVVRLAESAAEWHHREVNPSLGQWCDGYIVIRGTWCEPINADLLKSLNHRLVEIHRERRLTSSREE